MATSSIVAITFKYIHFKIHFKLVGQPSLWNSVAHQTASYQFEPDNFIYIHLYRYKSVKKISCRFYISVSPPRYKVIREGQLHTHTHIHMYMPSFLSGQTIHSLCSLTLLRLDKTDRHQTKGQSRGPADSWVEVMCPAGGFERNSPTESLKQPKTYCSHWSTNRLVNNTQAGSL